jgi:hypothetical protein
MQCVGLLQSFSHVDRRHQSCFDRLERWRDSIAAAFFAVDSCTFKHHSLLAKKQIEALVQLIAAGYMLESKQVFAK